MLAIVFIIINTIIISVAFCGGEGGKQNKSAGQIRPFANCFKVLLHALVFPISQSESW